MRISHLIGIATIANSVLLIGAWTRPVAVSAPEVVQARSFELVDSAGNVRAQIHLGDGGGQIRLRNAKGEVTVKLGPLSGGGSALLLMDPSVEPGIALTAGGKGPTITVTRNGRVDSLVR